MTLALCAALALSAPALAHGEQVSTELHVSAAGLDLATPSGARTMYAKLQAAAYQACHSDVSDPQTQNADQACVDAAMNDAASNLQSPAVTALLSGPKSDSQLLAAISGQTQLAMASDKAQPAGAVVDTGTVQPGSTRQPGMASKAWHAVTTAFGGK
jgi:UrcA family protein